LVVSRDDVVDTARPVTTFLRQHGLGVGLNRSVEPIDDGRGVGVLDEYDQHGLSVTPDEIARELIDGFSHAVPSPPRASLHGVQPTVPTHVATDFDHRSRRLRDSSAVCFQVVRAGPPVIE
jgi:hypothetical protein